ncbi:MAG: metallophosphoesterase [Acidobacteria bacterium]|nr:MAG: metallophosphoesterase [Acidobacteriota bacterium]
MATINGWREQRRVAQRRATPLRTIASGLAQIARAAFAEPYQLAVERHAVGLKRLPRELDGLKVVQLSDIHHGPLTSRRQVERAVEAANSLQPDIVALTGDYISHERGYVQPCAEMLGRLRARCGVYAVLGNHDNWVDAALVTDLFRAEGIRVLVNEGLRFEDRGASFWLAGVDDTMVGLEDLPLALAGSRDDEMKLLLAHNPVILRRAARAGVDLVLSGHTHGGQVTWRNERSASGRVRRRILRGLARRGETQIYVTRGLGTVVLPVRYGCLPEVTLLTLHCAD